MEAEAARIQQLISQIAQTKSRIVSSSRDHTDRNDALRMEKQLMNEHYQALKIMLQKFRQHQEQELRRLSVRMHSVMQRLEQRKSRAEAILNLSELCRRLETEEEKVMPFYSSSVDNVRHGMFQIYFQELPPVADDTADMERFFQRYNKVLLDKVVLEKEQESLARENAVSNFDRRRHDNRI